VNLSSTPARGRRGQATWSAAKVGLQCLAQEVLYVARDGAELASGGQVPSDADGARA